MFGHFGQYLKAKHGKLPTVELTEKEFVKELLATGMTKAQAKLQLTVAKGLGSSIMVGDRFLKLKE